MTELSGFSRVEKLGVDLSPQSLRVPRGKDAAIEKAGEILGGIWDAVENDLSPHVEIHVKKHPTGQVYCEIKPYDLDGVQTNGVALPGMRLAIDGLRLRAMTNKEYATHFTEAEDIEWSAETTPPAAEFVDDTTAKLTFEIPSSANRPFEFAVLAKEEGAKEFSAATDLQQRITDDTMELLVGGRTPGKGCRFKVVVTATRYQLTATSAVAVAVRPEPEPGADVTADSGAESSTITRGGLGNPAQL